MARMSDWTRPHSVSARVARFALLAMVLFLAAIARPATAQGCSQCRESVGQTPARTQQAYRRGIVVMVLAGAVVFTSTLVVLRRFR